MPPRDHRRGARNIIYNPASHRLRELERIIAYRHGSLLDTDDADIYLVPVAQTLRRCFEKNLRIATTDEVVDLLRVWARVHTPQMAVITLEAIAYDSMRLRQLDKADPLAVRLRLSYAERTLLRITTIGAFDVNKAARTCRRKERKRVKDRARAAQTRRKLGALPRAEYLAKSLSQQRPWEKEGISRRTWERRRKQLDSQMTQVCRPPLLLSAKRRTCDISSVGRACFLSIDPPTCSSRFSSNHGLTTSLDFSEDLRP